MCLPGPFDLPGQAPTPRKRDAVDKRWITLILLVFVALGTLYSVVVPVFEAPDEVWHYLYAKHFADGNGLPVYREGTTFPMRQEASQPPLFYVLNGWATAWIDTGDVEQVVRYNPHAAVGTTAPWGNRNMIGHTAQERFPYHGTVLAVHLVRFFCILMGAGTVLCTYTLARRLFPSFTWLPVVAAAINAFTPQFLFIHASVSNDVLVTLLSALTLWLLVCIAQDGTSVARLLVLGIVLGLAALTKLSGLLLLPLTALVLLALAWRSRSWRSAVSWGLWTFVPAAAIAGWWYLRNWMLYRDPFGLKLMFAVLPPRAQRPTFGELLRQFEGVFKSFWGVFGWFNLPMEDGVYKAFAFIVLLGAIGLVGFLYARLAGRCWRGTKSRPTWSTTSAGRSAVRSGVGPLWGEGILAIGLLSLWIAAYVLGSAGYIQVMSSQGRLLFPAMPAVAILLPLGLAQWLPARYARYGLAVLALLLLCLAVAVPYRYIAPAYVRPAALTAEERQQIGSDTPWSVKFGEQVLLVGYDVSETMLYPGGRLWVTLYWEALQAMDQNYSVFIHLVDDRGVTIAQRDSWPGAGNDPTSAWHVGQVRRDVHPLDLPTPLLAQGSCRLHVGLYDHDTGQRLLAYSQDGGAIDPVILPVELRLEGESTGALEELYLEFAGQIALTGYSVRPIAAHPGDVLQINLRWQALETVREDYTVFAHLVRGSDQIWGQNDHVPRNGEAPTSHWVAGQVVTETFELQLGADAPQDSYQLVVGLYESATVRRLSLPDGLDFVVLGQIEVKEK